MPYKNLLVAIIGLLFIFLPNTLQSTCILIFRNQTGIYVAADSRRILKSSDGKIVDKQTIMKIHSLNKVYFAISGADDSFLFDAAMNTIKPNKGINAIVKEYSEKVRQHYKIFLLEIKKKNPTQYNSYFSNAIAGVAFFGYIKDSSYLILTEFHLEKVNGKDDIKYYLVDDNPFIPLGIYDHIRAIPLNDIKGMSATMPPLEWLGKLVQVEVSSHKDSVGCPIDLLRLTNIGEERSKVPCH